MAFGRLPRRDAAQPMGDINMTPLIDVMLVLLVIFIIAAPLMATSLRLDLPQTRGGAPHAATARLEVAVDAQGQVWLGGQLVALESLAVKLSEAAQSQPDTEVHLRAHREVAYGQVAQVIGLAHEAGLKRVAFVTQDPAGPITAPAISR